MYKNDTMSINPVALKLTVGTSANAEVLTMRMEKKRKARKGNRFIFLFLLPMNKGVVNDEFDSEALKHALRALGPGSPFPKPG